MDDYMVCMWTVGQMVVGGWAVEGCVGGCTHELEGWVKGETKKWVVSW